MEGGATGDTRGIIPRAIEDIFATIGSDAVPHSKFLVRASYVQIYNEVRSSCTDTDLLLCCCCYTIIVSVDIGLDCMSCVFMRVWWHLDMRQV